MADLPPLRICLDARLRDGRHGGVQQVVAGLAAAFSSLDDGPEEYHFLVTPDAGGWIRPLLGGPCRVLEAPAPPPAFLGRTMRELRARAGPRFVRVPRSDGTIERARMDLMHFTVQTAFLTRVPSVFQPHDLLHLHRPEWLARRERVERAAAFPRYCADARMVVALTSWAKRDLRRAYGLPSDRVQVIPNAPAIDTARVPTGDELADARQRLRLPDAFIYFPAATWEHKNHVTLLDALARLRDRDAVIVPLVCSGLQTAHFPAIAARRAALGLQDQVRFLGSVSAGDVRCLYALARAMIFPSAFEGFGIPVVEAFAAGVPVACSNAASISDLAGTSAVLFAPDRADEMAAAIARIWSDAPLRASLVAAGRVRAASFSWDHSARLLRAHYRRVMSRPLTGDDRALLEAPPIV